MTELGFVAFASAGSPAWIRTVQRAAFRPQRATPPLEIVAEGAETAQQAERLRALDCDHIQGFYFAQPTGSQQADRVARSGLRHLDAPRRITSP